MDWFLNSIFDTDGEYDNWCIKESSASYCNNVKLFPDRALRQKKKKGMVTLYTIAEHFLV